MLAKITDFNPPPHVSSPQLFLSTSNHTMNYNITWNELCETEAQ
jgi:hypothetical protein